MAELLAVPDKPLGLQQVSPGTVAEKASALDSIWANKDLGKAKVQEIW